MEKILAHVGAPTITFSGPGVLSAPLVLRCGSQVSILTWEDCSGADPSYGRYLCEYCFDCMTNWSVPAAASPAGMDMGICRRCVAVLGYVEATPPGAPERTFGPPPTCTGARMG